MHLQPGAAGVSLNLVTCLPWLASEDLFEYGTIFTRHNETERTRLYKSSSHFLISAAVVNPSLLYCCSSAIRLRNIASSNGRSVRIQ